MWFELDPARLLSVIAWAYFLESGVQSLEAHPRSAMRGKRLRFGQVSFENGC